MSSSYYDYVGADMTPDKPKSEPDKIKPVLTGDSVVELVDALREARQELAYTAQLVDSTYQGRIAELEQQLAATKHAIDDVVAVNQKLDCDKERDRDRIAELEMQNEALVIALAKVKVKARAALAKEPTK